MDKNNILSGLEHLGFDNVDDLSLYESKPKNKPNTGESTNSYIQSLTYNRTITCPVCDNEFKTVCLKTNAYRLLKKDSDFFAHYDVINPYFYDVWVCNSCGYSSLKSEFNKISYAQTEFIKANITSKWKGREYPEIFTVDIAIERYKLSLLNYVYINSKNSVKAMNCLKIAWMYRLKENCDALEKNFIEQALRGFEKAFQSEDFPLFSMDKFSTMYLIGELYRRINNFDSSLKWFNDVIVNPMAKPKIKELAREQRLLVKLAVDNLNCNTDPIVPEVTIKPTNATNTTNTTKETKTLFEKLKFFSKK